MVQRLFADVINDAIWFMNIHEQNHTWFLAMGRLRTKLYDKRDDFNFPIVNFPFICRSRNQIQLFRINFHIRSRFGVLLFRTKIEKKYGKAAVLGQFSRVSSSQIQLLKIHYLKTFPVGRMMDGPSNLVTRG
jgi:hypothetical protein